MTRSLATIGAQWAAGIRTGLAALPRAPMLGLKRLILPVSYWRSIEFAYVAQHLSLPPGAAVLDLGSPKDLAIFLAKDRQYAITAVDILDDAVEVCRNYATALGIEGKGAGKVHAEVRDGRKLPYPDNSFDAVYSVSVIEHIPDHGDSEAIRELVRVVKPGGLVIITTPYDRQYRETFLQGPVYERNDTGKNFYQRHYDEAAFQSRLLQPAAAPVVHREVWGEGSVRMEAVMDRLGPVRTLLSPTEALCARLFLQKMNGTDTGHPMAIFFTLQKPQPSTLDS